MNLDNKMLTLYGVTDSSWLNGGSLADAVEQAIQGGATMIQMRAYDLTDEQAFLTQALSLKRITDRYRVPFIINNNVDIAVEVDADGAHIGQDDMDISTARRALGAGKILGVSVQTVEQAKIAQALNADYLGVGAVFPTTVKLDVQAISVDLLKNICASVDLPVVAIGGINKENISQLYGSGISGVAVISSIFAQPDITLATRVLKKLTDLF